MEGSRLLFYGVWGVGVVVTFSIVIICRAYVYGRRRDKRSTRDLLEASALWLVSAGAAASTASVALYPDAATVRAFLTTLSLGAFFGAGIVMAMDALEQFRALRRQRR